MVAIRRRRRRRRRSKKKERKKLSFFLLRFLLRFLLSPFFLFSSCFSPSSSFFVWFTTFCNIIYVSVFVLQKKLFSILHFPSRFVSSFFLSLALSFVEVVAVASKREKRGFCFFVFSLHSLALAPSLAWSKGKKKKASSQLLRFSSGKLAFQKKKN